MLVTFRCQHCVHLLPFRLIHYSLQLGDLVLQDLSLSLDSLHFLADEISLVLNSILLPLTMFDFNFDSTAGSFEMHKMLGQLWILIIFEYGDGGGSWACIDEASDILPPE